MLIAVPEAVLVEDSGVTVCAKDTCKLAITRRCYFAFGHVLHNLIVYHVAVKLVLVALKRIQL